MARGEVPFAILGDGSVVMARFRTLRRQVRPMSLDDPEVTHWTLALDGRPFEVVAGDGRRPWLPIGGLWRRGEETPLTAHADGEGQSVRYHYYYGHHLGSLDGYVTLTFDLRSMTVTVAKDLTFEAD